MGLLARFSVTEDLGYAPYTTYYQWPIDYNEGCEVFVETFLSIAKDIVPVDTGALRESIDAYTDGEEVECVAKEYYAQYVEFGTIKMAAQPYFEPAIEEAYAAARPLWEDAEQMAQEEDQLAYLEEMQSSRGAGEADGDMEIGGGSGGFFGGGGFFAGLLGAVVAVAIFSIFELLDNILFDGNSNIKFNSGGFASIAGGNIDIEIT